MDNLIEPRIAGVGFAAHYTLAECGVADDLDPTPYTWVLRGRPASDPATGDPAFELSTENGKITVQPVSEGSDEKEVVCTFEPEDTAGLLGVYRAQLIGTRDGDDVLGTEVEPFRFVLRF